MSVIAMLLPSCLTSGSESPNFNQHIAPILYAHCTTCHRPNAIGPFPLVTYADAKKRSAQLARITTDKIMPPWKPDAGHGEFLDDRTLSDGQIKTLTDWAAAGAPEGPQDRRPKIPNFPTGWLLGKPDLILKMPESFTVPAEGRDIYQHFVFKLDLKEDIHIRGVECRPGNPRVAHHAVGILDGSGTARKWDDKHPGPGYPGTGPGFIPAGFTPGYVPGQTPRFMRDGTAITVKKGTDFVLQMHYHCTGKVETDQTEIGFYLSKTPPTKPLVGIGLASEEIDIAAGESDYQARDRFVLPVDIEVTDIWAHMHMIGKTARVWAELPNEKGRRKMLRISDWDFNWQDSYRYREAFRLPKGTIIRAEWTWDNSASNPRNPFSPPRRIRLGEGSTDEMSGIWIGGIVDSWTDSIPHWAAVVGHYIEISAKGWKYR